jgi:hypothetical protein
MQGVDELPAAHDEDLADVLLEIVDLTDRIAGEDRGVGPADPKDRWRRRT